MRRCAVVVVLAGGLLWPGSQAEAALPPGNLIPNGNGELGTAARDEVFQQCPQGWNCFAPTNPTLVRYGTTTFPSRAEGVRIGGGRNFFSGGADVAVANASVEIELGAAAPEIDAGAAQATFSGCLGGWQAQDDFARLTLQFFTEPEAGGTFFPLRQVVGPNAAARGKQTKLLPAARTVPVPPGARSAVFLMTAVRMRGVYNDGYADNVSLTLGPAPGPAPAASPCTAAGGGGSSGGAVKSVLSVAGPARVRRNGTARIRLTCNSQHVKRCAGRLSASLVRGAGSSARRGTRRYSIVSLKTRTIRVALSRSDVRRIRRLSGRQLSRRRLRIRTVTTVGSAKVRQTSRLVVRRRG